MEEKEYRTVYVNRSGSFKHVRNKISTTKYNILTFIPRFLFEQFRKYANIYFLCIALLQQIPNVSPTGRFTTLVPLCIIISISALREIIEDLKRKKADDVTNSKKISVMAKGKWKEIKWKNLRVGDVVQVKRDEHFPADLILISSSDPSGMCYIETSNLDGETNLKVRTAIKETAPLSTEEELGKFNAILELQQPNKMLYDFIGNIQLETGPNLSLGPDQILLRGSRLKNTGYIYGVVAYAGYETKLMLNTNRIPLKRSTVDRVVNKQVLIMFCLLILLAWVSALGAYLYQKVLYRDHWYLSFLGPPYPNDLLYFLLTFVILYNNIIPISLQVTLEMVKFIQAIYIGKDKLMYHAETNKRAAARTSNLNEELGQVKYIFSDKTGTLTANIMTLKICFAGGVSYWKDFASEDQSSNEPSKEEDESTELLKEKELQKKVDSLSGELMAEKKSTKEVQQFLVMCAVCHSVVIEKDENGDVNYQASSPDERALVMGAKKAGVEYISRTPTSITFKMDGEEIVYQLLNIFEFSSARKRMTVIVKDNNNSIKVMVKGADSVVLEMIGMGFSRKEIDKHLEIFSTLGLRTLCFAQKTWTQTEYDEWNSKFTKANTSMVERLENIDEVVQFAEKSLNFVGLSAIEDKLQDGVPDTVKALLQAGIKIWVLTGDKQETAINIAMSCKLINPSMEIVTLNYTNIQDTKIALNVLGLKFPFSENTVKSNTALVIDGVTLSFALKEDCKEAFFKLSTTSKVVVCCRASPSQKAEIVRLVKHGTNSVTLAIGDGANDVGMIQEAHVGIGISGLEGLQAVSASDYSIAQFRFLKRLLLVHGHWNYSRVIKLILFCFYKNICFYFCEFWYAFLNGFSGQIIFERWTIGLYNVLFTAMPPLAIGIFDRVAPDYVLLNNPKLYLRPQSKDLFNIKVFSMWCVHAIYASFIVFWLPFGTMRNDNIFNDGKVSSLFFVGTVMYTIVVVTVCFKALIEMNYWNKMSFVLIFGSIVLWLCFLPIYCNLWPSVKFAEFMVGMDRYFFTSPLVYLQILIVPMAVLIRDVSSRIIFRNYMIINTETV